MRAKKNFVHKIVSILFFMWMPATGIYTQSSLSALNNGMYTAIQQENYSRAAIYLDSLRTHYSWYYSTVNGLCNSNDQWVHLKKMSQAQTTLKLSSTTELIPVKNWMMVKETGSSLQIKKIADSLLICMQNHADTNIFTSIYHTAIWLKVLQEFPYDTAYHLHYIQVLQRQNHLSSTTLLKDDGSLRIYLDAFFMMKKAEITGNYDSVFITRAPAKHMDLLWYSFSPESNLLGFINISDFKKNLLKKQKTTLTQNDYQYKAFTIVEDDPTPDNIRWLSNQWEKKADFETYWIQHFTQSWDTLHFGASVMRYIDSIAEPGKWMIIDIWGTWCMPCVQELPQWNKLYLKLIKNTEIPIQFASLSYLSKDLSNFMSSLKYSFPVYEVKKEEYGNVKVIGYPTTLLVSPSGKYTIIPFIKEKIEFIEAITLIKGLKN